MQHINESLKKYLAGFVDADGTIAFAFNKTVNGYYRIWLQFALVQAESNDKEFKLVKELQEAFQVGHLYYSDRHKVRQVTWFVREKGELEKFLPHIIKYMVIKGKHFQRMLEKRRELAGKDLTEDEVKELKEWAKQSRKDTGPVKHKNYPSPAWTAGYVDGDGNLRLYKRKDNSYEVRLKISSWIYDTVALEFLQKAYGGKIYIDSETVATYLLNLGATFYGTAKKFLGDIIQHLRIKRHKAELMLHWHKQRLSEKSSAEQAIV